MLGCLDLSASLQILQKGEKRVPFRCETKTLIKAAGKSKPSTEDTALVTDHNEYTQNKEVAPRSRAFPKEFVYRETITGTLFQEVPKSFDARKNFKKATRA